MWGQPELQMVGFIVSMCVLFALLCCTSVWTLRCVDPAASWGFESEQIMENFSRSSLYEAVLTCLASLYALDRYVSGQGSGGVPTSNRLVSPLAAFQARGIDVTFEPGATVDAAVSAAKAADVAIIFGSAHSGEGESELELFF